MHDFFITINEKVITNQGSTKHLFTPGFQEWPEWPTGKFLEWTEIPSTCEWSLCRMTMVILASLRQKKICMMQKYYHAWEVNFNHQQLKYSLELITNHIWSNTWTGIQHIYQKKFCHFSTFQQNWYWCICKFVGAASSPK